MQRKKYTSKKKAKTSPFLQMGVYGAILAAVIGSGAALSSLLPKQLPDPTVPAATGTPALPVITPVPTLTPTPAIYAPFGAQYGYGGEYLIPVGTAIAEEETAPVPLATEPPATPAPTAQMTLKKGMSGESVSALQKKLIDLGYLTGTADGIFGKQTEDAVVLFQSVNGLTADGLAGQKTLSLLESPDAKSADSIPKTDFLILVNRENTVERSFVPSDLVPIENMLSSDLVKVKYPGTKANRTAIQALGEMLNDAVQQGISNWQVSSAFRTYAEQEKLVENSVATYLRNNPDWKRKQALSATYNTVAPAGTSEHQTGLAFDMTVPGVSFTGTKQQIWLHEHCHEYGFIIRFTKDKQKLTGFLAESWHIRYVGKEPASIMVRNNWCLEEYIEKMGL